MIRRYGLFYLVVLLGCAAAVRDGVDQWVADTDLPPVLVETSVEMRDRHGELLRVFPVENGRLRLGLDLNHVDPDFLEMLIAYEDKRFYQHRGVDARAALRAAWQALRAGRIVSGGSTLTMQVARLLENSGTGRWHGKLRQVRVALALERQLTKDQILELYLAHAPYGGPIEGLRAASLAWFGKEPGRLTQAQSALLVALPQSPENRRPDRYPEVAQKARARVLARVGAPAPSEYAPLPDRLRAFPRLAPHLTDRLYHDGPMRPLHLLTLDADLQQKVEALLQNAVRGQPRGISAAMVVVEHSTGAVRASAGSSDYSSENGTLGFVDMTRAIRSPGSTLKPFVYGIAIDQGLVRPNTLITDAPVDIGGYAPSNFDGRYRGELTVRAALQLSLNIPPVLLTSEIGPARLMARLRDAGIAPQLPGGAPGLAVALGGVGVTLNDLVQLYAGLANGGSAPRLFWRASAEVQKPATFLSPGAAWQVADILADIPPPLGVGAGFGRIAYKTGTSYGHRDAWAIGFDGVHVVGVWLGRPDGTPVPGAFGGDLAAPLVFEAFGRLTSSPVALSPHPKGIVALSTASLPKPLQRFRGRSHVLQPSEDAPKVLFPPHGATLQANGYGVPLKIAKGKLPLTILINGAPVHTDLHQREVFLDLNDPGFSQIAIVDANGKSTRTNISLR
ncbi:MAG: penicillin-binding protein 1C [Pseudomonadota bacterium]